MDSLLSYECILQAQPVLRVLRTSEALSEASEEVQLSER